MRWLVIVALVACHPPSRAPAKRHYEVFVPSDTPGMPLVIVLHGNGGSGRQIEQHTSFDRIAAREQFIVAYPDAVGRHWNDGRPELDNGVDDVAFIASLIDELSTKHAIDRKRVYVTGMSNGAIMSYRVACDLADRVAAIAPVTGNLPAAIRCQPRAPVSVLAINGTADPLVPYAGGRVGRNRGTVLSAALSTAHFATHAGCGPATATVASPGSAGARSNANALRSLIDEPDANPADGSRTRRTSYPCPAPVAVELLTLEGAGHTWPGGSQYLPKLLIGGTSRDFDGAERIWEFFATHTRG